MSLPVAPPVLCEAVRSEFVEGRHRGSLVVLGADGSVEPALGDVTTGPGSWPGGGRAHGGAGENPRHLTAGHLP